MWFHLVWCRALLLAGALCHRKPCSEEMVRRVTELAGNALAKVMTLESRLWCKRDMAYLMQLEETRHKIALRGPWEMFVH